MATIVKPIYDNHKPLNPRFTIVLSNPVIVLFLFMYIIYTYYVHSNQG